MDATAPVNKPLVKAWAQWALVWLTFFPLVGFLVSIQLHNPEFLGVTSWFTFGRLRPVHTNGVIFGSFITAFVGLLYYFVPRLCMRDATVQKWKDVAYGEMRCVGKKDDCRGEFTFSWGSGGFKGITGSTPFVGGINIEQKKEGRIYGYAAWPKLTYSLP